MDRLLQSEKAAAPDAPATPVSGRRHKVAILLCTFGPNGPVELPYSSAQYGDQFEVGGYTYMLTQQVYAYWTGYGWQLVQ